MHRDYEQFGNSGVCRILVHKDVSAFLAGEMKNDKKSVRKTRVYLERLRDCDLQGMQNTEQLKHEGKFPGGGKQQAQQAVWAVKAGQLRVYGGFGNWKGNRVFYCIEAARKKRNKADQAQLKRVAKKLGELNV